MCDIFIWDDAYISYGLYYKNVQGLYGNISIIYLTKTTVHLFETKHIEVKCYFIRNQVARENIILNHVNSSQTFCQHIY